MWKRLRSIFFAGLIAILPVGLTIFVIRFLYQLISGSLGANGVLGEFVIQIGLAPLPGIIINILAVIITFILILLVGAIVPSVVGKILFKYFDRLLLAIPFLNKVYSTFRQLTDSFFNRDISTFRRVVLVEYPSKGLFMLGFETNRSVPGVEEVIGEDMVSIFIMSPPNPVTGMWLILPERDVVYLDHITVDEGFRMVMSLGISIPPEVKERLAKGETAEPTPHPTQ